MNFIMFDLYSLSIIIMEIEPRETPKVFVFRKAAAINRLVNKKLNIVEVDDKLQIVECRDTEN